MSRGKVSIGSVVSPDTPLPQKIKKKYMYAGKFKKKIRGLQIKCNEIIARKLL